MKRTPIVIPGQVYLHREFNEYLVITAAHRGDITYQGVGFKGHNEAELLLERFQPVDPADIKNHEKEELMQFIPEIVKLSTGWVPIDEELGG